MRKLYILSFILLPILLQSQGWERHIDNMGSRILSSYDPQNHSTCLLPDGSTVFRGTDSMNYGHIVKMDGNGNLVWSKRVEPFGNSLLCLAKVPGGYILGGHSAGMAAYIGMADELGNLIWKQGIAGAYAITAVRALGTNIIIAGQPVSYNGIYLGCIDQFGNILWSKTISENYYVKAIEFNDDGGFVLVSAGEAPGYGDGSKTILSSFDSAGNLNWSKKYSSTEGVLIHDIHPTADGGFLMGGNVLMKVDRYGNRQWSRRWGKISSFCINADSTISLVTSDHFGDDGITMYKTTASGKPLWKRQFGSDNDNAANIFAHTDGSFRILGYRSGEYDSFDSGLYLIKTDADGYSGCNSRQTPISQIMNTDQICITEASTLTFTSGGGTFWPSLFLPPSSQVVSNACCMVDAKIIQPYFTCEGDSIIYQATGSLNLLWHDGSTSPRLATFDTMVYVTATNTCGSNTDTMVFMTGDVPVVTVSATDDTICRGESVTLSIGGNAPYISAWGPYMTNISTHSKVVTPIKTSVYEIAGTTGYYGPGCSSRVFKTIYVSPDQPRITNSGDTLITNASGDLQWYKDSIPLPGATSPIILNAPAGVYYVTVTAAGCNNVSEPFHFDPANIPTFEINAFQETFYREGAGCGNAIVMSNDGNFIIAGQHNDGIWYNNDFVLMKVSPSGNIIWEKKLGTERGESYTELLKTDAGYFAAGNTSGLGHGNFDGLLTAFTEDGTVLWSKTYGDWNDQYINSIAATADGGFLLSGYTTDPDSYSVIDGDLCNHKDVLLIKTNASGDLIWSKRYDSGGSETSVQATELTDGSIMLAGESTEGDERSAVLAMKTDASGNILWSRIIANSFFAAPSAMKVTPDGGMLICTGGSGATYLLKLDNAANVEWSKMAEVGAWGTNLILTSDGNVVFTSGYGISGTGVTKIDMNGNLIWSNSCSATAPTHTTSVIELSDGSFALTGSADSVNIHSGAKIQLLTMDNQGRTNCNVTAAITIDNEPFTSSAPVITGYDFGSVQSVELVELPSAFSPHILCRSSLMTSIAEETPDEIELKLFPNPGTGIFNLETDQRNGIRMISVYDIAGRQVLSQKSAGGTSAVIDLQKNSAGIYFVEVSTAKGIIKTRLVLTR